MFKELDFILRTWLIAIPLAVWKIIDIIIWILKHFRIDII